MGTVLTRLGVAEFATAGSDLDTGRVVAARIAVLDEDGREVARWDWGSDRAEAVVGEVAQTLRALVALGVPLAVYDAAAGLTVLDRECRRRGLVPLDSPSPVLDPLLLDHLVEPEFEGSRSLSALAARYGVEPGALVAGRLVRAMCARDELSGTPAALHARQRGMVDDWPVAPLEDVRLIEDTQPLPAPPPRPSDTVPMFDFTATGTLALEAPEPAPDEEAAAPTEPDDPWAAYEASADEEPAEPELLSVADVEQPEETAEPSETEESADREEPAEAAEAEETAEAAEAAEPEETAETAEPDSTPDESVPELIEPEPLVPRAPRRIHVAAAIVTDPEGRAVVVRKRGTTGFMQPGGKIERGESALACLIRELDEELGLAVDVDATEFLGSFEAPALNEPGATVRAEVFALVTSAELHPTGEIDAVHWLESPDDTESVELAPLTLEVLLPLWAQRRRPALF